MRPLSSIWIPLVAALFSVLGIWLGARLTERRAYREKNWDRKAVSYAEIFEAIGEMELLLNLWFDRHIEGRDTDEELSDKEAEQYRAAKRKMLKTLWRESWSLPEKVVARIEVLKTQIEKRYDSWFEDLDASAHACKTATIDLRKLARTDMMMGKADYRLSDFLPNSRGLQ